MTYEIPSGKYNKWCERRPLVCSDSAIISRARKHLANKQLTSTERSATFLHDLVNCQGLEFVAFGNAHFKKPLELPEQVVLFPCFLPEIEGENWKEPLVQLTYRMMELSRFIYDGWIPISDWRVQTVRKAIRKINQILTVFSIQERTWFTWEPKYMPTMAYPHYCQIEDQHLEEIQNLSSFIKSWTDDDSKAFYRSVAWLSQSLVLPQPIARFLFCICAIESLASYIEKESRNNSAFLVLRSAHLTRPERKEQREECIKDTLNRLLATDPTKAVNTAYFECVAGTKKMLMEHLKKVFSEDSEAVDLLFRTRIDGQTLYDLRNVIAHGEMDALDDLQRQRIADRIWDIERIARQYFVLVLRSIWNRTPFVQKMIKSTHFPFLIVSNEKMYKGPIHMAEIYVTLV